MNHGHERDSHRNRFGHFLAAVLPNHSRWLASLLALLLGLAAHARAQSGCGVTPVKPVRPVGCKDLVAQCQCDDRGRCRWVWVCVK